jgi:hypothetical protein
MNFIDCANEGKKQASVSKKRRFIRTLKKFNVPFQTFLRASNKITACKKNVENGIAQKNFFLFYLDCLSSLFLMQNLEFIFFFYFNFFWTLNIRFQTRKKVRN